MIQSCSLLRSAFFAILYDVFSNLPHIFKIVTIHQLPNISFPIAQHASLSKTYEEKRKVVFKIPSMEPSETTPSSVIPASTTFTQAPIGKSKLLSPTLLFNEPTTKKVHSSVASDDKSCDFSSLDFMFDDGTLNEIVEDMLNEVVEEHIQSPECELSQFLQSLKLGNIAKTIEKFKKNGIAFNRIKMIASVDQLINIVGLSFGDALVTHNNLNNASRSPPPQPNNEFSDLVNMVRNTQNNVSNSKSMCDVSKENFDSMVDLRLQPDLECN